MPAAAVADHEACYRAVKARDARFDGRFCTAVVTTGIYCRPSCPARTPKPTSVRFFACAAAAEEAGFRACKRCRPESAPGDPGWDRRGDLVARAVRLIADGAAADGGVPGLARRLHVSERQLRRLFVQELGTGPLQVSSTRRLALARLLLDQTDLPVTRVAFAAGFASIRRFNAAMAAAFGSPPSLLRQRRADPQGDGHGALRLRLATRLPFAGSAVLAFLAAHATPGVEEVVGGTYRRTVDGGVLAATPDATGLTVDLRLEDVRHVGPLVGLARRLFDLDCDPLAVAEVLGADPLLAPALAATPGIRLPGAANGFEAAVRTVLGQQVSVAGATTLAGRLVRAFGPPLAHPDGGLFARFPDPAALASADLTRIGLTTARAATIASLSIAVADGYLDLSPAADRDEAMGRLLDLPGVGPWTAAIVAARAWGDPDAFPASDLTLRRLTGLETRALLARSDAWRPWRSYVAFALWAQRRQQPGLPNGVRPDKALRRATSDPNSRPPDSRPPDTRPHEGRPPNMRPPEGRALGGAYPGSSERRGTTNRNETR